MNTRGKKNTREKKTNKKNKMQMEKKTHRNKEKQANISPPFASPPNLTMLFNEIALCFVGCVWN